MPYDNHRDVGLPQDSQKSSFDKVVSDKLETTCPFRV